MSKGSGKRISIFYILVAFFLFAFVIVIYINNIIEVNNLAVDSNNVREEINKVKQTNDFLRTEVERLSSYERIRKIASENLSMVYADSSVDNSNIILIKASELK
jgi:cell division protein FtsL